MRFAIFLTFDDKTQTALQNLREAIAQHVPGTPSIAGKMGPHMTLAVFDDPDETAVTHRFKNTIMSFHAFPLAIRNLGAFNGRWRILYAAPLASPVLHDSHRRIHMAFSLSSAMVPHYVDPANWVPHITLAKGLKGRVFQEAKVYAEKNWKPLGATVLQAGLINVQQPLMVLAARSLPRSGHV